MKRLLSAVSAALWLGLGLLVAAGCAGALGLGLHAAGLMRGPGAALVAGMVFALGAASLLRGDRDVEDALVEMVAPERAGGRR